jgi:RND family efflux transporter MFP subunit
MSGSGERPLRRDLAGLLALLVLAISPGCGGEGDAEDGSDPAPVPVGVVTIQLETTETRRTWVGQLEPLRTVAVQAPRDGRVEAVTVREGDRAQAGQVVVRMQGPELDARLATLSDRRDQLADELARWERLAQAGAAGQGEVAQARLRLFDAEEQLSEAEALVEAYEVRSPASGRVSGVSVTGGARVVAGQPLMQVDDDGMWGVRLSVTAWETSLIEDTERLTVRGTQGESLAVDRVALSADDRPGFAIAQIFLRDPGARRGGVEVEHRSEEEVLLVPWTAVAGEGDRHWVALVVPGDPPRVERRTVELGQPHPRGVVVLSGLEPGDRIVRYEPRSHPEGRVVEPIEDGE